MGKFNREFLEQFQVEDAAKTCMKLADGGGVVVSWEQGLGKTVLAQLVAKALRARRVLFIVPQDIVQQWTRTAEEMFLTDLRPIAGLRQALRVQERLRKGQTGWYVTWYEALSQAGKIEEMLPVEWKADVDAKGKRSATPFVRTGLRETTQLDGVCPRCGMTQSADKQGVDQHMRDLVEAAGLGRPFGEAQARAYKLWLHHFAAWYIEKHPDHPISEHPKLIERSAGILGQFAKLQFICTLPEAESDGWAQRNGIIVSNYTPKNVAVIRQAAELVNHGRKVVIFSAVKEHSLWMAKVLNGLGYPALSVVEERTQRSQNTQHSGLSTQNSHIVTLGPQGRADLVRDFIHDGFPILCASIHAMNLGHNLDCASAVIINGLPWDFATFDQAIARVHRITSKRPVDIYIAQTVCREDTDDFRQGASLDQKMRRLVRDKGDSAAFALDGTLPEREEITEDLQAFLESVTREWREPVNVLDERDLTMQAISWATISLDNGYILWQRPVHED